MILIINEHGFRLCQDNRWRLIAHFGTKPECVKQYKSVGWARRKARRIKGIVVRIPSGVLVEAAGTVYDSTGLRSLRDFAV
jgi:hypothetical protein